MEHYNDEPIDFNTKYGYNRTSFCYPFERDQELSDKLERKKTGNFAYPTKLEPIYDPTVECKHGNTYDGVLILLGTNVTVIHQREDEVLEIERYGRTSNSCNCILQMDTHDLLLWNLGNERFLDYHFLLGSFQLFCEGTSLTSQVASRDKTVKGMRGTSVLTVKDLDRGFTGFCYNMALGAEDFTCEKCGETPEYLILDGKQLGPGKKEVEHLEEFERHPEDDHKLDQGSTFESRVFLNMKNDRTLLGNLADGRMNIRDFPRNNLNLQPSTNWYLVINLVNHIYEKFRDEEEKLPSCYRKLLSNLSKITSVSGFLQPTCPESLDILERFCKGQQNIRLAKSNQDLKLVMSEFPALWPQLEEILNLTDRVFLPDAVAEVIKKVIEMRRNIFESACNRSSDDYVRYDWEQNHEHETMFYPHWDAVFYPKQYKVGNAADQDLCQKNYRQNNKHPAGLFSGGCPHNITYGFEMTLHKESPHNAFRLLECREIDRFKLKGIVYDFACGLNTYVLNREPSPYQYTRFLVDGCHWNGHSKTRKGTTNNGHKGCSDGFNFNLYKEHIDKDFNSQGREQTHSILQKLAPSLRNMNYTSYMIVLIRFFGYRNMFLKGIV